MITGMNRVMKKTYQCTQHVAENNRLALPRLLKADRLNLWSLVGFSNDILKSKEECLSN